jgi:hypothetical protein
MNFSTSHGIWQWSTITFSFYSATSNLFILYHSSVSKKKNPLPQSGLVQLYMEGLKEHSNDHKIRSLFCYNNIVFFSGTDVQRAQKWKELRWVVCEQWVYCLWKWNKWGFCLSQGNCKLLACFCSHIACILWCLMHHNQSDGSLLIPLILTPLIAGYLKTCSKP